MVLELLDVGCRVVGTGFGRTGIGIGSFDQLGVDDSVVGRGAGFGFVGGVPRVLG